MTRPARAVAEPTGAALRAVAEAVAAIAVAPSLETTLRGLVEAARRLASCRYAAVGIPDGNGGFSHFITTGMSDELIAAIGPLPRTHGLLGAMLERPLPHRTADISRDPALPLVAGRPPADDVLPGRPHRLGGRGGRRLLPDRQDRRRTSSPTPIRS